MFKIQKSVLAGHVQNLLSIMDTYASEYDDFRAYEQSHGVCDDDAIMRDAFAYPCNVFTCADPYVACFEFRTVDPYATCDYSQWVLNIAEMGDKLVRVFNRVMMDVKGAVDSFDAGKLLDCIADYLDATKRYTLCDLLDAGDEMYYDSLHDCDDFDYALYNHPAFNALIEYAKVNYGKPRFADEIDL